MYLLQRILSYGRALLPAPGHLLVESEDVTITASEPADVQSRQRLIEYYTTPET